MALIRINPTKMLVGGNQRAAKNFLGPARSQLEILKQAMSFQNLSQGVRKIWLNDDVYVECRKIFNYQECRVWVRPAPIEEELLEEQKIYFYVRIVQTTSGDTDWKKLKFLNKNRDNTEKSMDRLVLWEVRKEHRTVNYTSVISSKQSGEYEDGSGWVIDSPGKIVLDVDVYNRIVYSESNGIPVENDLSEEDQLAFADKYMEQIDHNEQATIAGSGYEQDPEDLATKHIIRGEIYSPLAIADACYLETSLPSHYFRADFSEPVEQLVGPTGDLVDWYHVIDDDYTLMVLEFETLSCKTPEEKFFRLIWPKLDINKDKYLPTQRDAGEVVAPYPDGWRDQNYAQLCASNVFSITLKHPWIPGGEETYSHDVISIPLPEAGGMLRRPGCGLSLETTEIEHVAGNYYISDNLYPCFFVTVAGRTTSSRVEIRSGRFSPIPYPIDGEQPTQWWSCETPKLDGYAYTWGTPGATTYYNRASLLLDAGEMFLSTPLEQFINPEEYLQSPITEDLETPEWLKDFLSFSGGATGSIIVYSCQMLAWAAGAYPTLAREFSYQIANPYISADRRLCKSDIDVTVAEKTSDFASTFSFVKFNNKPHAALVAFKETNIHASGERRQYVFPTTQYVDRYYFTVGVVFYLMFPVYDTLIQEEEIQYWDIHSERESSQEEINHNREPVLEDYVGAILRDIKELPQNRDGPLMYEILKSKYYDMTTGFVAEIE